MNTVEQETYNDTFLIPGEYSEFLRGLTEIGVTWVNFHSNGLGTEHPWWMYREGKPSSSLEAQAIKWLEEGHSIGIMPGNGLYALHFHTQDFSAVEDYFGRILTKARLAGKQVPMVSSSRSGIIALLALPPDFCRDGLRNRVWNVSMDSPEPTMDIVFGPDAVVPILGPLCEPSPEDSDRLDHWRPSTRWSEPPTLDPRLLVDASSLAKDSTEFSTASGTREERTEAARRYLAKPQYWMRSLYSADFADDTRDFYRHLERAKEETVKDLIAYFRLDPITANLLLWEYPDPDPEAEDQSWMDRLVSHFGENTELLEEEFMHIAEQAMDQIPYLGIAEHQTTLIGHELETFADILKYVSRVPVASTMSESALFDYFLQLFHRTADEVSIAEFQDIINDVVEQKLIPLKPKVMDEEGNYYYAGISRKSLEYVRDCWDYQWHYRHYWSRKMQHKLDAGVISISDGLYTL